MTDTTDVFVLFGQNLYDTNGRRSFVGVFGSVEACEKHLQENHARSYDGLNPYWWESNLRKPAVYTTGPNHNRLLYPTRVKDWGWFYIEKHQIEIEV